MSVSFRTINILQEVSTISFKPVSRQQISRLASGAVRAKDFGSALWTASYATAAILHSQALGLEAELDTLDGSIFPFEAWDLRRPWPLMYRDGSANDGELLSVNANRKMLALSGLLPGQIVSIGDYLSFDYGDDRALHRISETVVADEDGSTEEFEVRPHLRPGWSLSAAVNLKAPRGIFNLVPGSLETNNVNATHSAASFQAMQYFTP